MEGDRFAQAGSCRSLSSHSTDLVVLLDVPHSTMSSKVWRKVSNDMINFNAPRTIRSLSSTLPNLNSYCSFNVCRRLRRYLTDVDANLQGIPQAPFSNASLKAATSSFFIFIIAFVMLRSMSVELSAVTAVRMNELTLQLYSCLHPTPSPT